MNEFYTRILKSMGIDVSDDGVLLLDSNPWKVNDVKVVLPNSESARDIRMVDGKPTALIFNPIQDNVLKISPIMRKLVKTYNMKMEASLQTIITVGYLSTMSDIAVPPIVSMFVSSLSEAKGNAKKLMDDNAMSSLKKSLIWAVDNDKFIIQLFAVNGIDVCGEKVTSAISYTSPLLDEINDDESEIHNILKRRKDRDLLELSIKHLLDYLSNDTEYVLAHSSSESSPMFTAFLKGVIKSSIKLNRLLEGLSRIDKEICNDALLPKSITTETVAEIQEYASEATKIVKVDGTNMTNVTGDTSRTSADDSQYIPGTTIKQKGQPSQQHMSQQHMSQPVDNRLDYLNVGTSRHNMPRHQGHHVPQQQGYNMPQQQGYGIPQQQGYGMPQHQAPFSPDTVEVYWDDRARVFIDEYNNLIDPNIVQEDAKGYFVVMDAQPVSQSQRHSVQFRR